MKSIIIVLLSALALSAQEWRIIDFSPEGDSIIKVKYRGHHSSDTGIVRQTKVEKWKCKNLRVADTTYKTIRIIPQQEVEE